MDLFSFDTSKITLHALAKTKPRARIKHLTIQKLYIFSIISIYFCVSGVLKTI